MGNLLARRAGLSVATTALGLVDPDPTFQIISAPDQTLKLSKNDRKKFASRVKTSKDFNMNPDLVNLLYF